MVFLIKLLLAHLIGDFFLQPNKWVENKERRKWRSPYLYLHIIVHYILILAITWKFDFWKPALIIVGFHLLIDLSKLMIQKESTKRLLFFMDQLLHIITILAVWSTVYNMVFDYSLLANKNVWVTMAAFVCLFNPAAIFIKIIISKWPPTNTPGQTQESLQNAGKWIGILERTLILIFILLGKWEGVGFLLAAKSVFRFGDLKDAKDMKLTEYVLIGTLLSFGIAILIGIAALHLLAIK